jgi:hypothetical protein
MATLSVGQFGGLTDFHIGAQPQEYEKADNLVVDEYGKLISRPGTLLDFTGSLARAQVSTSVSTRRIGLMLGQTTGSARDYTTIKQAGEKLWYDNGSAMTELVGPASASAFTLASPITGSTAFAYAEWNKHSIITHESPYQRPVKVYNDSGGTLRLRTAGLPIVANTYTATGGAGANYIYALVLKYTYTVEDVTYIDRSAPQFKEFTNIGTTTPGSSPGITVGSIPVLANTTGLHYDTTAIKVEVYRTTNAGAVLYYVGEVTNGTTSISDTVSDTTLQNNETLYTTGGIVGNDRPPTCKYVHGTTDYVYYAHGTEVSVTTGADLQLQPQRLWQSKRGDPDSVPQGFYADMEQPITGVSSVRSIPVVFCDRSIYRIDGSFDNQGRNGMIPKKISDSVGAVGHLALVQTLQGIFFVGTDGFYFTDGYQVVPLSENFRQRFPALVDTADKRKRICGALDLNEQRVVWAVPNSLDEAYPVDDDNAGFYCLDIRKRVFTTWGSGYQDDELNETLTGTNVNQLVTFSDTTGVDPGQYVFRNDELAPLQAGSITLDVTPSTVTVSKPASDKTSKGYTFLNSEKTTSAFRNMLPTAILFANKRLYFGDRHGFTRYFSKTEPSDVWIDASGNTVPTDFDKLPIFFDYRGSALDLGTTQARKYVTKILVKARPLLDINAEMTLTVSSENDDSGIDVALEPIYFQRFIPWGSPTASYGDPRLWRPARTIIDTSRRFSARGLRCEYKQISMRPGFVPLFESNQYDTVEVTASGISDTVKSASMSTRDFPSAIVNYYISFEADNYTKSYLIIQVSGGQVDFSDPDDEVALGTGAKWVIRGYLKASLINLIEYSLFYEVLGPSQLAYQGENAVNQ